MEESFCLAWDMQTDDGMTRIQNWPDDRKEMLVPPMQTQMQDRLTGIANYWVPVNGGRAYKRGTDVKCMYISYWNDERSKLKKKKISALQGNILPATASVIVAHGL